MHKNAPTYIFDLDGTLVDSRADLATAVNLMRADFDLSPLSIPTITTYVGNGIHKLVERALADATDPVDPNAALPRLREHYSRHLLDQTCLYPGVCDALDMLSQTPCQLAVVTNKPAGPAGTILRALGIADRFSHILGGDSCPTVKPDPAPILHVLESDQACCARSWIIGDNVTDLEAGRRARVRRCFCRYGFGKKGRETADLEVDDIREFADYVRRQQND